MTTHAIGAREGQAAHAAAGLADRLPLMAAPTFAVMALLTGIFGSGAQDMLCSSAHGASPLNGMASMYLLMSVFHSAPWLKLISRWRSGAHMAGVTPERSGRRGTMMQPGRSTAAFGWGTKSH
jgi:hypothetical protein